MEKANRITETNEKRHKDTLKKRHEEMLATTACCSKRKLQQMNCKHHNNYSVLRVSSCKSNKHKTDMM